MLCGRRHVGGEVGREQRYLVLLAEEIEVFSLMWKKPSTLVWPERQNTLATAKRATSATKL
jgi:hypothetical protein